MNQINNPLHPKSLFEYKYYNRQMEYRTENFEISPEEMNRIHLIQPHPVSPYSPLSSPNKIKLIIDTDIGTDLDDSLALLYALRLSEIDLLGVTTNYGPSKLRAGIAEKIIKSHLQCRHINKEIPVIPGAESQIGSHLDIFLCGKEGAGIFSKEQIIKLADMYNLGKGYQYEAADFIAKTIMKYPNEVTIASIGIPTNIALAITKYPNIIPLIKEIVFMGGGSPIIDNDCITMNAYSPKKEDWNKRNKINFPFKLPKNSQSVPKFVNEGNILHLKPNHNFSGDAYASSIIFQHPEIKCRIISSMITHQFWLTGKAIDYFKYIAKNMSIDERMNLTKPSSVVAINLDEWFEYRIGNSNGQCPHDPLIIHEIAFNGKDNHVVYLPGTLIVHEWAAFSTFIPHNDGNHLLGVLPKDIPGFLSKLSDKLVEED